MNIIEHRQTYLSALEDVSMSPDENKISLIVERHHLSPLEVRVLLPRTKQHREVRKHAKYDDSQSAPRMRHVANWHRT